MEERDGRQAYVPCRVELKSPTTDWSEPWRLCGLNGISSELQSFNFKLIHELLVTKKRMNHLRPHLHSPYCSLCDTAAEEDMIHAMVQCTYNSGVGTSLMQAVNSVLPDVTPAFMLRLELKGLSPVLERGVILFISTVLKDIWDRRMSRSTIQISDTRTTLEARCQILRKSRFDNFEFFENLCKLL